MESSNGDKENKAPQSTVLCDDAKGGAVSVPRLLPLLSDEEIRTLDSRAELTFFRFLIRMERMGRETARDVVRGDFKFHHNLAALRGQLQGLVGQSSSQPSLISKSKAAIYRRRVEALEELLEGASLPGIWGRGGERLQQRAGSSLRGEAAAGGGVAEVARGGWREVEAEVAELKEPTAGPSSSSSSSATAASVVAAAAGEEKRDGSAGDQLLESVEHGRVERGSGQQQTTAAERRGSQKSAAAQGREGRGPHESIASQLRRRARGRGLVTSEALGSQGGNGGLLDQEARRLVERNRNLQEELTEEMLQLAGRLKQNSLAMNASVMESHKILDSSGNSLETNVAVASNVNKSATSIYRKGFCTGLFTWIAMFFMLMMFVSMILFIKIT